MKTFRFGVLSTAVLLSVSMVSCGPNKSVNPIPFPADAQIATGEAFLDGHYEAIQIETFSETDQEGSHVTAYFNHKFKSPGSPKDGDDTEHWMHGWDSSRVLTITPEINIPISLIRTAQGIELGKLAYYWNYVRSNDGWRWRISYSSSSSGFDINNLISLQAREKASDKALFNGPNGQKAAFVKDANGSILLYSTWMTSDDGRITARVRYVHTEKAPEIELYRKSMYSWSAPASSSTEIPPTPAPLPPQETPSIPKNIEFSDQDKSVEHLAPGSAIVRDRGGKTSTLSSRQEIEAYGQANGYGQVVVTNAYEMATASGNGVMGFASDRNQLVATIADMVSHMKTTMNANSDDLELVFAVDYSQSMDNNIRAVITELKTLVNSFQNVTRSGRAVKIGIVTFGEEGHEKMELNLTSDLALVQSNLDRLLSDYRLNSHSDEPGEACYGGLDCAAKNISWSSLNRQVIVITDEESKERVLGRTTYIHEVEAHLRSAKVYPVLVKIAD